MDNFMEAIDQLQTEIYVLRLEAWAKAEASEDPDGHYYYIGRAYAYSVAHTKLDEILIRFTDILQD